MKALRYNRRLRLGGAIVSAASLPMVSAFFALCGQRATESSVEQPPALQPAASSAAVHPTGGRGSSISQSLLARYRLDQPELEAKLPGRLKEVSGITAVSATQVACIQDESGIIYIFDLRNEALVKEISFGPPGDYEGIAHAHDSLFVLRSDGLLYQVAQHKDKPSVTLHQLAIAQYDNEGLCFDAARNRLLVAPKSLRDRARTPLDARPVLTFDLNSRRLLAEPSVVLSVDAIVTFAEARQLKLPKPWQKQKKRQGAFLPAAIALHPISSELFVLSAVDRVLATFDGRGQVTGYVRLDKKPFRQPEGLTFMPNGDLVITSEASGKKPRLVHFRMQAIP